MDLRSLARIGAETRLGQLEQEQAAILAEFPDLRAEPLGHVEPSRRGPGRPRKTEAVEAPAQRRPHMTPAQRRAVSERMRKYWATRRRKAS